MHTLLEALSRTSLGLKGYVVWQLFRPYKFLIVGSSVNYGLQLNMKDNVCTYGVMKI